MKGKNISKLVAIMMLASVFPLGINTARADEANPSPAEAGEESKEKTKEDYQKDLVKAKAKKENIKEEIQEIDKDIYTKEKQLEPEKSKEELSAKLEDLNAKKETTKKEVEEAEEAYKKAKEENPSVDSGAEEKIKKLFPTDEEIEEQKRKVLSEKTDAEIKNIHYNNKRIEYREKQIKYQVKEFELAKRKSNLENLQNDEAASEKAVIDGINSELETLNKDMEELKIYNEPEYKSFHLYEPLKLEHLKIRRNIEKEYKAGNINAENINTLVAEEESLIETAKNNFSIANKKFNNHRKRREEIEKKKKENNIKINVLEQQSSWIKENKDKPDDYYFKYNKEAAEQDLIKMKEEISRLYDEDFSLYTEFRKLNEEEKQYYKDNELTGYNSIEHDEKLKVYKLMKDIFEGSSSLTDANLKEKEKNLAEKRESLKQIESEISETEDLISKLKVLTRRQEQNLLNDIEDLKTKKQGKEAELDKINAEIASLEQKIASFIEDTYHPSDLGAFTGEYMFLNNDDKSQEEAKKKEAAKERLRKSIPRLELAYRKGLSIVEKAEIYLANETMPQENRDKLQMLINKHKTILKKLAVLIVRLEVSSK